MHRNMTGRVSKNAHLLSLRLFCIVEFLKIDDVSVFYWVTLETEPHGGGLGVADLEHDPRKRN